MSVRNFTVYRGWSYENGRIVYIGVTSRTLVERMREHDQPLFLEAIDEITGTLRDANFRESAWIHWYEKHGVMLSNRKHVRKPLIL